MHILILSCNTGGGHNAAAAAIRERLNQHGHTALVCDALEYWSPEVSKLICKGHVFLYRRLPKLFGAGYRFEENHPPKKNADSVMYSLMINGCEALYEELCGGAYDAVICTHVFPGMMLTEIKRRHYCHFSSYFVATDYTCSPGVSEVKADAYFIPHRSLTGEFASCGLDVGKLVPSGIPIREEFYRTPDRQTARAALGLPPENQLLLLSCGSMGCGPIKEIAELFARSPSPGVTLAVICGSNKRLFLQLKDFQSPRLLLVGYTREMALYMDAAEVIITKPGGLSSTEAAAKGLPAVLIDAVPGCETRNIEFFRKNGFAVSFEKPEEILRESLRLLSDKTQLEKKSRLLRSEFGENAAEIICRTVTCSQPLESAPVV